MAPADHLIKSAADLVANDRANTHGDKRKNHKNIAALWNAYLDIRRDTASPLTEIDVAQMMVLLKLARTQLGAFNQDDYVDLVGYAAIAGELAS